MDQSVPPAIVTPSPSPAPTLMPLTYVMNWPPPVGQPGITQIALSARTVHSGDHYLAIVLTTPDVVSVVADANGFHFTLFPAGPGRFGVMGQFGTIPFFAGDRTVSVRVTATTADGRTATQLVDVRLAR
jgi:hypothetical protein